ncbi:skin secretory protein xP2-like [Sardina pilchardus]|uniref:skin secretory protein xP2-like n=1 Tax=Sardina pilchardus TaxID=27697 RepID=UPI002E1324E7
MRKLLVCAVLIALLTIGTESSRLPRQAEEEGDVPAPAEEEAVAAPAEEEPVPAEEEPAAPAEDTPHAEEQVAPAPAEEAPAPAEEDSIVEAVHEEAAPAPAVPAPKGTVARVMNSLRSYYDTAINTASGYLEAIRGLKLEEKAKNLYVETTTAVRTYAGVMQDQLYHMIGAH